MNTAKLIQTLAAMALILIVTPAWAMDKDTGYPWYRDLLETDRQTVSKSGNIAEVTVLLSEKDTGYPWFADIKNDNKPITKQVTIFKSHPRPEGEDSGYPWHTDIYEDNPA